MLTTLAISSIYEQPTVCSVNYEVRVHTLYRIFQMIFSLFSDQSHDPPSLTIFPPLPCFVLFVDGCCCISNPFLLCHISLREVLAWSTVRFFFWFCFGFFVCLFLSCNRKKRNLLRYIKSFNLLLTLYANKQTISQKPSMFYFLVL